MGLFWCNYRKADPVAGFFLLSKAGLDTGNFLSNLLKSSCFVDLPKEATVVFAGLVVLPTLSSGTVGWREMYSRSRPELQNLGQD